MGRFKLSIFPFLFALGVVVLYSYEMDILLMGDTNANTLGVNTTFLKCMMIGISTLLISVLVSLTGIIGFIGLVIPHISRKLIGYQHKTLVLFSVFLGGSFFSAFRYLCENLFFSRRNANRSDHCLCRNSIIFMDCKEELFLWRKRMIEIRNLSYRKGKNRS
ncbi:hypothetical protein C095_01090 [Fusobacterium necrophorum subsp. funduliforme B35]|uniref:Uncharacterized protein n=1 Tax=Fusobacterium necrophorum subsp. funduliforme B35 TaxID=1226633 RepID=A0A0B4ETE8_9FUSO|nr:hypothetical protein C095_01090 [Fusobacterium necrophorum subsp. funduliforme B35]